MHDNPLELRPFNGLKDYLAFFVGRGSYWYREKQVREARRLMAEHLDFIGTFPDSQRQRLTEYYGSLRGLNKKALFVGRLETHLNALKAQQAQNVSSRLPQDVLRRIERMPAEQQEVMREYYLKKIYGKDFERVVEENTVDDMMEAFLG